MARIVLTVWDDEAAPPLVHVEVAGDVAEGEPYTPAQQAVADMLGGSIAAASKAAVQIGDGPIEPLRGPGG